MSTRSLLSKVLEIFDRYIIMDDVEVSNVSGDQSNRNRRSKAADVLRAAALEIPELDAFQFANLTWLDVPVTAVRGTIPGVPSFDVLEIAPEQSRLPRRYRESRCASSWNRSA